MDLRSPATGAALDALLCEKSLQQSFRCASASFPVTTSDFAWGRHERKIDTEFIGSGSPLQRRPVVLVLVNSGKASAVDVDNVRLVDNNGHDLVANGDFSEGGAHWFFSADDHLPWHIFNLWIQILFEQGWVGVIAAAIAVAMALARLADAAWRGDFFCTATLAALVGMLLVGLTESLLDGPRVALLFFLLVFVGLAFPTRRDSVTTDGSASAA
jgi:hypothetical protein